MNELLIKTETPFEYLCFRHDNGMFPHDSEAAVLHYALRQHQSNFISSFTRPAVESSSKNNSVSVSYVHLIIYKISVSNR